MFKKRNFTGSALNNKTVRFVWEGLIEALTLTTQSPFLSGAQVLLSNAGTAFGPKQEAQLSRVTWASQSSLFKAHGILTWGK